MSDWISLYPIAIRSRTAFALVWRASTSSSPSGPEVIVLPIIAQWRNWTKRVQWRGPYFRSDEILCVRSADPLIVHNFEAESLALGQAGHFCAFDGT